MSRHISQREARRLQRDNERLRAQDHRRRLWVEKDYPGGAHIATVDVATVAAGAIHVARLLDHEVVARDDGHTIRFFAILHERFSR